MEKSVARGLANRGFSRRRFIGAAALGMGGLLAAAACSSPATPTAAPAKPAGAKPAEPTKAAETKPAAQATAAPAAKPAASGQQTTITFSALGNDKEFEMYNAILDVFEKKVANIKVDRQLAPGTNWQKVEAMFAGGTATDLIRVNDDSVYWLGSNNKVVELDPYLKADVKMDAYYPATWQALNVDGKQRSFQVCMGCNTFYYNIDLFKAAGVEMPPTTWKEAWDWNKFVEVTKKLAKIEGGKTVQYALAYPINSWTAVWYSNGGVQYNADETKCTLYSPKAVEITQEWGDFVHKLKYAPFPEENQLELWNGGKLAMWWQSMSVPPQFKAEIKWDIMPMPKAKERAFTEFFVRSFAIPTTTKSVDAAFALGKFFMEKEGQEEFAKRDWGVPTLKSVAEGPVFNDPKRPPAHRAIWAEGLNYDVPLANNPLAQQWKFNQNKFTEVENGQKTADQWLKDFEASMDAEIKKINWKKKG